MNKFALSSIILLTISCIGYIIFILISKYGDKKLKLGLILLIISIWLMYFVFFLPDLDIHLPYKIYRY